MLGNLQPFPNPFARFKWAARRGGKRNVERERGKRKERKGKGGIRKGGVTGVALAPRKNFQRTLTLQFITKLVYRWKASHRNG